jgi:8-oxo-dGTP pyrophosphatase MutT (NUDIX family)
VAQPTPRTAARVLLIDDAHRVLLLHGTDPADPTDAYWLAPGGGLEPGETPAQAAARELFEETGLRVPADAIGAPVHHDVTEFPFDGAWYRQTQAFYLVRVASWAVDFAGHNAIEQATVDAYRWWSAAELRATGERFYPPDLADVLDRVLREAAAC